MITIALNRSQLDVLVFPEDYLLDFWSDSIIYLNDILQLYITTLTDHGYNVHVHIWNNS